MHVLKCDHAGLIIAGRESLDSHQENTFNTLVARRVAREPIAYLVGHREFWSLDVLVNPSVLIPRPETELLVQRALTALDMFDTRDNAIEPLTIADLGTGSGAVAIAIATERPNVAVIAVDNSDAAIHVAALNKDQHSVFNVQIVKSDWFDAFDDNAFNIVVSNPPYLSPDDEHLDIGDLVFEPRDALVSGNHGLFAITQIVQGAKRALRHKGWLIVEHGYEQGVQVRQLFKSCGFDSIRTQTDLAGLERVTEGRCG